MFHHVLSCPPVEWSTEMNPTFSKRTNALARAQIRQTHGCGDILWLIGGKQLYGQTLKT
jgi:dihydrofolate reductase